MLQSSRVGRLVDLIEGSTAGPVLLVGLGLVFVAAVGLIGAASTIWLLR